MEKDSQLPVVKLADNVPLTVRFDGVLGKEFHNEKYNTKSYLYVVYDIANKNKKKVWFATEKQHLAVQEQKVDLNKAYTLLKQKLPGEMYSTLKVMELPNSNEQTGTNDSSTTEQLAAAIVSYDHDTQSPTENQILPEAATWAIKTAVMAYDIFDRSHVWPQDNSIEQRLHYLAKKFLTMQQKLVDQRK